MKAARTGLVFIFFIMVCGLTGSSPAGKRSVVDDFSEANRAYEAGDLPKAIQIYEALAADVGFSASLCYNLANSYARNGQTGKAILGYERALRLAPGDIDIRSNLELVRKEKGLMPAPPSFLQQMGGVFGLNQWAVLAMFWLTFLALLPLATWRFTLSVRFSYSLTTVCLLLFVICAAGVAIQYRNWQQAVILRPETPLLISPFDGAGSTGVIEEGRLVRIIKSHDGYALINDEKGRSGWIAGTSFELIAVTTANKKNL